MSNTRSSSMDNNLSHSNYSNGHSRVSQAEARRLQEQRLQSYGADNGNNLMPRLWDRAGAQYAGTQYAGAQYPGTQYPGTQFSSAQYASPQYYTQSSSQYNNGQGNDRSNASRGA